MREIKFRGRRSDYLDWVFGDLIHQNNKTFIYQDLAYPDLSIDRHLIRVISETVGQYIGLRDKNDVEIYEGDIVILNHSYRSFKWTGEIVWCEYMWTGLEFSCCTYDDSYALFSEGTKEIEVIGNIQENPELLTNGKD